MQFFQEWCAQHADKVLAIVLTAQSLMFSGKVWFTIPIIFIEIWKCSKYSEEFAL